MTRPSGVHLTSEELDHVVTGNEESPDADGGRHEIAEHVTSCEKCQNLVRVHQTAQKKLFGLKSQGMVTKTKDCPNEADWVKLAAGFLEANTLSKYLEHAITCDYCGRKMREAIEDLRPTSPEENALFTKLEVSQPSWKDNMAKKIASTRAVEFRPAAAKRTFILRPIWMLAAAAVLAVTAVVLWWRTPSNVQSPEDLLAKAYVEHRTLELRFGSAHHAVLHTERGAENRPLALVEAEAFVLRGLTTHPRDATWIQAKGRADLLAWNYESAIKNLKEAQVLQPGSAEVLTDLASAYFERAEATNHKVDYQAALNFLGQALQIQPNNLNALFNRAVISERVKLMDQAVSDWNHYLELDPNGDWSSEARGRLDNIQKKNGNTR